MTSNGADILLVQLHMGTADKATLCHLKGEATRAAETTRAPMAAAINIE